jgi:hypothetical protein
MFLPVFWYWIFRSTETFWSPCIFWYVSILKRRKSQISWLNWTLSLEFSQLLFSLPKLVLFWKHLSLKLPHFSGFISHSYAGYCLKGRTGYITFLRTGLQIWFSLCHYICSYRQSLVCDKRGKAVRIAAETVNCRTSSAVWWTVAVGRRVTLCCFTHTQKCDQQLTASTQSSSQSIQSPSVQSPSVQSPLTSSAVTTINTCKYHSSPRLSHHHRHHMNSIISKSTDVISVITIILP